MPPFILFANSSLPRLDARAVLRSAAPRARLVAVLLGCATLAACSSTPKPIDCTEPTRDAYRKAQDLPPLKVPAGMETPDRRNALVVPPAKGESKMNAACLERAPSYFGTTNRIAASPEEVVADWAQAWADRNVDAVMGLYANNFDAETPEGSTAWLERRRTEVATAPAPQGRIEHLKIATTANDQRSATFVQKFGSAQVMKEIRLTRESGVWKIAQERVLSGQ